FALVPHRVSNGRGYRRGAAFGHLECVEPGHGIREPASGDFSLRLLDSGADARLALDGLEPLTLGVGLTRRLRAQPLERLGDERMRRMERGKQRHALIASAGPELLLGVGNRLARACIECLALACFLAASDGLLE